MAEILSNAKAKVQGKQPLTEVEKIVLREYVIVLKSELQKIQLKSQRQMLTDVEYARMQSLQDRISKYGVINGD